jgi:FMN phosphatase YigB (HAD superfamily)
MTPTSDMTGGPPPLAGHDTRREQAADPLPWERPLVVAYDYAGTLASHSARVGGRPREQPVWATAARVIRLLHNAGIPAILSSNTAGAAEEPRLPHLHAAGIAECFIGVLCSADYPFAKPDPRWYQLVLDCARRHLPGCRPQDIVHVGDPPVHDVIAAERAGLRAVFLTGQRADTPATLPPHTRVIAEITELPGLFGLGANSHECTSQVSQKGTGVNDPWPRLRSPEQI